MNNNIQGEKSHFRLDFTQPSMKSMRLKSETSLLTPILALSTPEQIKMITATDELPLLTPTGLNQYIPTGTHMIHGHDLYGGQMATTPTTPTATNTRPPPGFATTTTTSMNPMSGHHLTTLTPRQANIAPAPATISKMDTLDFKDELQNIDDNHLGSIDSAATYTNVTEQHVPIAQANANQSARTTTINTSITNKHRQTKDVDVAKIEKKKERNRLAAKKCRQKKIETIEELRKTINKMEADYQALLERCEKLSADNYRLRNYNNQFV